MRRRRIVREELGGWYLYCAADVVRRQNQLHRRREGVELPGVATRRRKAEVGEEAKAAVLLFFATLDERQRRLYAGLESLRWGHGGDRRVAEWTDLDVHTVARGRQELLAQDVERERVRKAGAGRMAVEKKRRR